MASLSKNNDGRYRIFYEAAGKRRILYLGKEPKKTAETIYSRVSSLESAHLSGAAIDPETARWLGRIGDSLHAKLAKHGLVEPREERDDGDAKTLGELVDWYVEDRGKSKKERTLSIWNQSRRSLVAYFGEDRPISDITEGDVESFWEHLKTAPRSEKDSRPLVANTYKKRCSIARQIFQAAVRKKWIDANPFKVLSGLAIRADRSKSRFVTIAETEKLLNAAPCAEWRAIIALCRFCGLRCPSEVLALTWEDVLWDQGKLRVPVPKLEHIEGKGERFTPLFAPVREALDDLRELAEPGTVHVITRYRDAGQNLRTTFKTIIGRAGLTPWPRPLHNLRLSCQTELSSHLPAHAVCEMLGNSEAVAREHYLRTTDADFEKALTLFGATHQTTQNASEPA